MAKRKTDEEFKSEIEKLRPNIKISGKYKNCNTKLHCLCNIHNYEWDSIPTIIRLYGCPVCSGHIITESIYKERLNEVHGNKITLVSGYVNMTTKCIHHCNKHNIDYLALPTVVLKGQECRLCMKEKLRKAALISKEDANERLYSKYGNEFELCDEYHGVSERHKFIHHLKNGTTHEFTASFSQLFIGQGCGVCSNNQILIGYNDIATTNPEIASLFENEEDTHKYVELSNQTVNFRCPDCGNVVKRIIANVVKNKNVSCHYCSDGISYPNKFIYNCLMQISDLFDYIEREYKPKWCTFDFNGKSKRGYYDVYFEINGNKYIIEMDGGLGHGNQNMHSYLTGEDTVYIDKQKDMLAKNHNIKVIRIDCFYDKVENRYEFIKNNIINSSLKDIICIQNIDFDMANVDSLQSMLLKACDLWNNGMSVKEVGDAISVNQGTARSYLYSGNKYGLCNYTKDENNTRTNKSRTVICLNTMKTYSSISNAAKEYNLVLESIRSCCCGKSLSSGELKGDRLVWRYIEDYKNMSDDEIRNALLNAYTKKVVCLTNNILFATLKDASEWINVSPSAISKCCTGITKSCGKDSDTNTPLKWMYYDNYISDYKNASTLRLFGRLSA